MNQEELGILCICAERYALGRRTYMPSEVCGIIKSHIAELSDKDIYVLIKDLECPYVDHGDQCDRVEWMRLLDVLKTEWKRRRNDEQM